MMWTTITRVPLLVVAFAIYIVAAPLVLVGAALVVVGSTVCRFALSE